MRRDPVRHVDMEGVLVGSTTVMVRAWHEWAEKHGLDVERILA